MPLLISDTNILIDLEEGGLLDEMFSLPVEFAVPDVLFFEELEGYYPHLATLGLQVMELTSDSLTNVFVLTDRYPNPSTNDCFALSLALQEQCPLVTGDAGLRSAAGREGVVVKGTIWVVEELVKHGLVSVATAHDAYRKMEIAGSRLPWGMAHTRLDSLDV